MKRVLSFFLFFLFFLPLHAFNNQFDNLVVLGDSLSDNGNLYRYMWHIIPASPPYYEGHFSNGLVWTEFLHKSFFGDDKDSFNNYAIGGAGAVLARKQNLPYTIAAELDNYLFFNPFSKKENSLFSIWIGANNYVNAPDNVDELTSNVVDAIGDVLERLIDKGGDKFIIGNLPDLAQLPLAKDSNPQLLTELALTHNRKLAQLITKLKDKYPQVLFIEFDAHSFFEEIINNGPSYGFFHTNESCYGGGYTKWRKINSPTDDDLYLFLKKSSSSQLTKKQWLTINSNPILKETALMGYHQAHLPLSKEDEEPLECDDYIFWDKVHPTTNVHEMMASQVKNLIDEQGLQAVQPQ